MEITLEEKIRGIFNSCNTAKIEKVLRTKDGEKYYKYVWSIGEPKTQCSWFGFDTLDECCDDFLTYLTIMS